MVFHMSVDIQNKRHSVRHLCPTLRQNKSHSVRHLCPTLLQNKSRDEPLVVAPLPPCVDQPDDTQLSPHTHSLPPPSNKKGREQMIWRMIKLLRVHGRVPRDKNAGGTVNIGKWGGRMTAGCTPSSSACSPVPVTHALSLWPLESKQSS